MAKTDKQCNINIPVTFLDIQYNTTSTTMETVVTNGQEKESKKLFFMIRH